MLLCEIYVTGTLIRNPSETHTPTILSGLLIPPVHFLLLLNESVREQQSLRQYMDSQIEFLEGDSLNYQD